MLLREHLLDDKNIHVFSFGNKQISGENQRHCVDYNVQGCFSDIWYLSDLSLLP